MAIEILHARTEGPANGKKGTPFPNGWSKEWADTVVSGLTFFHGPKSKKQIKATMEFGKSR